MQKSSRWLISLLLALIFSQYSLANEKVVLQLKWKHQFQFAGYYAAKSQGYFENEGLEVEIREIKPGLTPINAVLEGNAQFGISDSSLVLARLQGKKPVVLATIFQHSPLVLLTLKSSGIINPLELKDKKIMFSRDVDDAVLTAMFTEIGITAKDYNHVPHSFDDSDLITGKVDAMSAYITNQAFALPQKNIPINIISPANYGIDFYGDMLFVEENYFKNNKQQALAFRRAAIKGWHYAINNQEEVVDWIIKNLATNKSKSHLMNEAEMTARIIQPKIIDLGYFSTNRFIRIADTYKQLKLAPHNSSFEGISYKDYLGNPIQKDKWIQAAMIISALLASIAFILWMNNFRLKAKVKDNTVRLEKANKSMARYLNVINQYINSCVLSTELTFIKTSEAWRKTLNVSSETLTGTELKNLLANPLDEKFIEMQLALDSEKDWSGEIKFNDTLGNTVWFDISVQLEVNEETLLNEITLIAIDISDHKRIEILSLTDSLTGLANRRHFDTVFENEFLRMQRNNTSLSLLLLDVDFFKQYNDMYGHQAGDLCLQTLSDILANCAKRPADLVARFGGEEFIILLPDTDLKGAFKVGNFVMSQLEGLHLEHLGSTASKQVTLSIGIAMIRSSCATSTEEVIRIADEQLYKAKSSGRNKICSNKPFKG